MPRWVSKPDVDGMKIGEQLGDACMIGVCVFIIILPDVCPSLEAWEEVLCYEYPKLRSSYRGM
jgi:hypothetical protein